MKHRTTFTAGNVVLLMVCTFVWGAQFSSLITGYVSFLSFSFTSVSCLCVIAVVYLSARKRSLTPPPSHSWERL